MEYKKIEIDLGRVEYLASLGLNIGEIAGAMGVSRKTLDRRREEDGEIDARIAQGKGKGIADVASALMKNALRGDVAAQKIYLNSVAGWAKTSKVEFTAPTLKIFLTQEVETTTAPEALCHAAPLLEVNALVGLPTH